MSALLIAPEAKLRPTRRDSAPSRSAVLAAIRALQAEGKPTSISAIVQRAGVSANAAQRWRARLVAEGLVTCIKAKTGPAQGSDASRRRGLSGESEAERQAIARAIRNAQAHPGAGPRQRAAALLSVRVGKRVRCVRRDFEDAAVWDADAFESGWEAGHAD